MPIEQAVDEAVRECIEKDILVDIFEEERSAVMLEVSLIICHSPGNAVKC